MTPLLSGYAPITTAWNHYYHHYYWIIYFYKTPKKSTQKYSVLGSMDKKGNLRQAILEIEVMLLT